MLMRRVCADKEHECCMLYAGRCSSSVVTNLFGSLEQALASLQPSNTAAAATSIGLAGKRRGRELSPLQPFTVQTWEVPKIPSRRQRHGDGGAEGQQALNALEAPMPQLGLGGDARLRRARSRWERRARVQAQQLKLASGDSGRLLSPLPTGTPDWIKVSRSAGWFARILTCKYVC